MKILFLPTWYPNEKNQVSGIFIKEHARAVSIFNDVIVLYPEGPEKSFKKFYEIYSDSREDGIRTIRIKYKKSPVPKVTFLIYIFSIISIFKKLVKSGWKPDIIHIHVYLSGIPAVIIGKMYNIPVILTEHNSGFINNSLRLKLKIKALFVLNNVKIILPVSSYLKNNIKKYTLGKKFQVIPNVINTNLFYPETVQKQNKIKNILLVSVLIKIKGISYLLNALAKLRQKREDFILDIVGDGDEKDRFINMAKELNINDNVRFHGMKSKEEVAMFMRNCDFYVQPSFYETFGITFIEAMACGKPVIGTRIPALEEKIGKDAGILVPVRDADALADAINYMLDNHQNYSPEIISKNIKDIYSFEAVGKKLNDIYIDIISDKL